MYCWFLCIYVDTELRYRWEFLKALLGLRAYSRYLFYVLKIQYTPVNLPSGNL